MPSLPFFTIDVFTRTRFGGNPLAVVIGGDALDDTMMQAMAAEFNLSETTFVLEPVDPNNIARVRIFNRTAEMAFAGHPMIGTAVVVAKQRPDLSTAAFEIPAGIARFQIERDANGAPVGAGVDAPQPLTIGETIAPEVIAHALRLTPADVVTTHHAPVSVSNGNPFVVAEVTEEALSRCDPDLAAIREALETYPQFGSRFPVHVYNKKGRALRARMFAPLAGTWEDPATGSANTALACLLLSLEPNAQEASFHISQGVEMGRPSLLRVDARRTPQGIVATLRGSCVAVMRGEIEF